MMGKKIHFPYRLNLRDFVQKLGNLIMTFAKNQKEGDQEVGGCELERERKLSHVLCCTMRFKRKGAADKPIKDPTIPVNLAKEKK